MTVQMKSAQRGYLKTNQMQQQDVCSLEMLLE